MTNKRMIKKLLSIALASGIAISGFGFTSLDVNAANTNSYGLATNIKDGNILHCFDWTYQQIIDELPNIAAAGFTSIQTSPAQPANASAGSAWYYLYQPNGFYVGNAGLGSESDLKRLCSAADNYGIKIIVDVVANHLAGDHTNIDASLKDSQYWHNLSSGIDYNNRYEITHKDIGMADLNSEHPYVQEKVKNYVAQLKSDGVDGIRWDAAKHISLPSESCGFWSSVIDRSIFNYGEILGGPVGGNTSLANSLMSEYTDYMSVSDSVYSTTVMTAFNNNSVPSAYGNWVNVNGIDDNEVVYFAESHDTFSNNENEEGWTKYISQNKVDRAYAILGAKANSSALYFSRPSETNKHNIKVGVKGSTHFKSNEVAAVNKLHNSCVGEREYYSTSGNIAILSRETGASIALGSGSNQNISINNPGGTLQPGTYTDQVNGGTFTVTDSTIKGFVGASGIAVLLKSSNQDNPVSNNMTLYFTNNYNWNNIYAYTWGGSSSMNWPGKAMTYAAQNDYNEATYSITVPSDITGVIFTDGNGNQTVDITNDISNGKGYYITGNSNNKYTVGTYSLK